MVFCINNDDLNNKNKFETIIEEKIIVQLLIVILLIIQRKLIRERQ
jgi:hypothetical protein